MQKRFLMLYLLLSLVIVTLVGCAENQSLSMLLDQTTKPTTEIASEAGACFKDVDVTDAEYAFVFDKACIDTLLLSDRWTASKVAEMVSQDDFRLEGRAIQLTGQVGRRFEDSGIILINTGHDSVDIWIRPPYVVALKNYDAKTTVNYKVGNIYTIEISIDWIGRERARIGDGTEYTLWCDLILE